MDNLGVEENTNWNNAVGTSPPLYKDQDRLELIV